MSRGFHDDFLTELKAVDDFLAYRTGDAAYVQREDPDVRRLVESIAFFAARTRRSATDQLRRSMLQLARGQLDDFLAPQPARGLVQALPGGLLADTAYLPAGTLLRLTAPGGELGLFSTMDGVTLRPLQIDVAELQLRPGRGFRIAVRIRARREVVDLAEPLAVHVSYLNDYAASLRFHYRLRRHLLPEGGASVFYDASPEPSRVGAPCELRFGGPPRAAAGAGLAGEAGAPAGESQPGILSGSRVDALRTFFHFPARELRFHVALPRASAPWRQAWLCLDLDEDWPAELVVNRDVFRLFVIPIENLVRDAALPVKHDGTRARFPIAPVRDGAGLALHSVIGVFQETPAGREPLLPAHLAGGGDCYDVEQELGELDPAEPGGSDGPAGPELVLRLPEAFAAPRLVSVDARWYQPRFDSAAVGRVDVRLQTRHVYGVELRLLGGLASHRPSPLWTDPAAMLHVLSRRASRVLSRGDLTSLMSLLGADDDSHHADLDDALLHVETREEPAGLRGGGGLQQVYRITVGDVGEDRLGLLEDYLRGIEALLDAWSASPVRLEVQRRGAGGRPQLMTGSGA